MMTTANRWMAVAVAVAKHGGEMGWRKVKGQVLDEIRKKMMNLDSPEFSGLGGHDARSSRA